MDEDAGVDWIPLWKHRMSKITDILTAHQVESVLDLGCGEGKLLQCLRHIPKIKTLAGVDLDTPSLTKAFPALQPLLTDLLQPRLHPLSIELYRGCRLLSSLGFDHGPHYRLFFPFPCGLQAQLTP